MAHRAYLSEDQKKDHPILLLFLKEPHPSPEMILFQTSHTAREIWGTGSRNHLFARAMPSAKGSTENVIVQLDHAAADPGATADDAALVATRPSGISFKENAAIILIVPVRTLLPHIPCHLKQAVSVRLVPANGPRHAGIDMAAAAAKTSIPGGGPIKARS